MAEPVGGYQRILAAINALRGQKAKEETAVSLLSSEQKASYDAVMAGRPGAALPAAPVAPAAAEPVDFFSFTQEDAVQLVREIADSIAAGLGGVPPDTLGRIKVEVYRGLLNPQYTVALSGDVGAYTALRIRDWERQIRIFPTYVLEGERLGLIYSQMRANDLIDEAEYDALVREAGAPNLVDEWAFGVERDALSKLPRMMQQFSAGFDETGKKPHLPGLLNTAMQAEMQPNGPINTPASLFPKVRTPPEEDRLTSQFEAGVKTEGALGRAVDAALEAAGWSLDERAYNPAKWKAFEVERGRLKDAALGMRDVNRGQDAAMTARQIADAITTSINFEFKQAVQGRFQAGEAVTDVNEADNAARDYLGARGVAGKDVTADFFQQVSDWFLQQGVNSPASQTAAEQEFGAAKVSESLRAKQVEAFDTLGERRAFVDEWLDARGLSKADVTDAAYAAMARNITGLTKAEAGQAAEGWGQYLEAFQAEKAAEAFDTPAERLSAAKDWLGNVTGLDASAFRASDVLSMANSLQGATSTAGLEAFGPKLQAFVNAKQVEDMAGDPNAVMALLKQMGVTGSAAFQQTLLTDFVPKVQAALQADPFGDPFQVAYKAMGFGQAFPEAAALAVFEPFPAAPALTAATEPFAATTGTAAFQPAPPLVEEGMVPGAGRPAFTPPDVAPPAAYRPGDPATKRMVDRYREVTALLAVPPENRPANWQALAGEQHNLLIAMYRSGAVLPTDIEAGRDAYARSERARYEAQGAAFEKSQAEEAVEAFSLQYDPARQQEYGAALLKKYGAAPSTPSRGMIKELAFPIFPETERPQYLSALAGPDAAFQSYLGQQFEKPETVKAFQTAYAQPSYTALSMDKRQDYLKFFESKVPAYQQAFEATPAFRERRQAETAQKLAQAEAEREQRRQKALRRGRQVFV